MEFYSTYEVRIKGTPTITTRIADSELLLGSFFDELKRLISDHKLRHQHEKIKKPVVVGLDVEYYSYMQSSKAAILQLCFGTHCVIIQLLHMEINKISSYLNDFFADHSIVFVGVGIKNKLANLSTTCTTFQCTKNVIDLGSLVDRVRRTCKFIRSNVDDIAREIIGIKIKERKPALNLTAWGSRDLTTEQIEDATIVAYASYSIGNKLLVEGGNDVLIPVLKGMFQMFG